MANQEPTSRAAITDLHTRGWTDAAIGRAVGRDSSLIHQIAEGKKPGANLRETLGALDKSGLAGPKTARQLPALSLPEAPRRTRASGQPAQVRRGRAEREALGPRGSAQGMAQGRATGEARGARPEKPPTPDRVRVLPNGQRHIAGSSKASANFVAGLAGDISPHARINVAYKDADGKWHMPAKKGGMSPEQLRAFTRGRSWKEALEAMSEYFYGKGGDAAPTGEAEFYIVGV